MSSIENLEKRLINLRHNPFPNREKIIETLLELSSAYFIDGNYLKAKRSMKEVVRLLESIYGKGSPEADDSLWELADIMVGCDELEESFRIKVEVLGRIIERDPHDSRLWTKEYDDIMGWAESMSMTGDLREVYSSLVEITEKAHGGAHEDVARTLGYLAENLEWNEDYEEAIRSFAKALSVFECILSPLDPDLKKAREDLDGCVISAPGVITDEEASRSVVKILSRVLGDDHPAVIEGKRSLILSIPDEDSDEKVAEVRHEIFASLLRTKGADDAEAIEAEEDLALSLSLIDSDEASRLMEDVLERRKRILGPRHKSTIDAMETLARYLPEKERKRSIDLLERVVEVRRETLGPSHPETKNAEFELELLELIEGSEEDSSSDSDTEKDIKRRIQGLKNEIEMLEKRLKDK